MKKINFAVVGFGGISKTHILGAFDSNLRGTLPFELNCVAALTRKECDTKVSSIKNYTDFDKMIKECNLDFIDICTPNGAHLEFVKRASDLKIPVYCEKPLASNIEDALKMVELVSRSGIKNAVALNYRFVPAVNVLKEEIEKGVIGDIINFRFSIYHSSYLSNSKAGTWRTLETSGGGALMDLGVHSLDMVNYTIGDICDIETDIKIHFKERSHVDEYAFSKIKTKQGYEGTVEVSRISAETHNRDTIEVFGEKGSLKVTMKTPYVVEYFNAVNGNTTLIAATAQLLEKLHFPNERASLGFFQSAHTSSISEFANSIFINEKSMINGDFNDGYKVQNLVAAAYSKLKGGSL